MHCIVPIKLFVLQYLKDANIVNENTVTKPNEAQEEDLLLVHTARYLKSLKVMSKYGYTQTCVVVVLPGVVMELNTFAFTVFNFN
jgi:acetoin utilization deacetylase AcuC-like enzyme